MPEVWIFILDRNDKNADRSQPHFFDEIVSIVDRLRAPDGCPWDREQKLTDLRTYIVEEAYELAEAITDGETEHIREEAGDLLLQIVFAASIAKESGDFDMADVVRTVCDKLIRRHPHVFRDVEANDSEQVLRNWEKIKLDERRSKKEDLSILAGVPKGLPPLVKAQRIQGKAAHVGFDWPAGDLEPLFGKLEEETLELREAVAAGDGDAMENELGDLLFMTVNLARHLNVSPDAALSRTCEKFSARFRQVEKQVTDRGLQLSDCSLQELDAFWDKAKQEEEHRTTVESREK